MTGPSEFRGFVRRLSVPLSLLAFVVFGSGGHDRLWLEHDGTFATLRHLANEALTEGVS